MTIGCDTIEQASLNNSPDYFLYYGGTENEYASVSIDNIQFARRPYFLCEECIDYDGSNTRYLTDSPWVWDQKTCRVEDASSHPEQLFCVKYILESEIELSTEGYMFSDINCDYFIPAINTPINPESSKVQECNDKSGGLSENVCGQVYISLEKESSCKFSIINEPL